VENIKIVQGEDGLEHIIIDRGNEEFTSMPKATYEAQQAAQQAVPNE
jgi:hypothetical protein